MADGMTGRRDLKRRLARIPKAVREEAVRAVLSGAEELANLQYSYAPVEDGDLRNSIEVTEPGGATPAYSQPGGSRVAGPTEAIVTAGNGKARYAHLVEFGVAPHINGGKFAGTKHPGTKPQPFFWPAYRLLKKRISSRITRGIKKGIRDNVE